MTPPPDAVDAGGPGLEPAAVGDGLERPSGSSGPFIAIVIVAALALVAGAAIWVAASGGGRDAETIAIVVPPGTADRLAAGEKVEIMPTRLEFRVGDMIRIRNDDDVEHSVGPYQVKAGQEMVLRYGAVGVYEGYCPLSEGERYEIVVKP